MTNPTKAAERLMRAMKTTASEVYKDEPRFQHDRDIQTLADAYLAEHAADDELPIDEAWLRSIGDSQGCEGVVIGPITVMRDYSVWKVYTHQSSHWHLLATFTTRGQLRRLCQCLNITLKPIEEEGK